MSVRSSAALVCLSLPLLLAGCGGSNGGGGNNDGGNNEPTTIPVGVYTGTGAFNGTQTINGQTTTFSTAPLVLAIVTASGSYQLISWSAGSPGVVSQLDVGLGGLSSGAFVSSADLEVGLYPNYNSNDLPLLSTAQGAALSATFVPGTNLTGSITYPGSQGDVLSFPLGFAAASTTAALQAAVAGSYPGAFYSTVNTGENINESATSTLTISSTGAISGQVDCPFTSVNPPPNPAPCTVSGTLLARTDVNAYDVSIAFANGVGQRFPSLWVGKTATGLAYRDATSGKLLFAALAPDNTGFAFSN